MNPPLFSEKLSTLGRIGSIQRVGSRVIVAIHDEHGTCVGTVALSACALPVDREVRLAIIPQEIPS
jgi:hypothetical protein